MPLLLNYKGFKLWVTLVTVENKWDINSQRFPGLVVAYPIPVFCKTQWRLNIKQISGAVWCIQR